ncbi:MAG: hypothetical protein JSV80_06460 [Acidobacteriota bacterium]|nr:MAG: hypothetical protein JSV80_06460 [Acidobacteriota bacterium]
MSIPGSPKPARRGWWPWAVAAAAVLIIGGMWLGRARLAEWIARPIVERERAAWEREQAQRTTTEQMPAATADHALAGSPAAGARASWQELTGVAPSWPADPFGPVDCAAVREELWSICRGLAGRGEDALSGEALCEELLAVGELLVAQPPVAAGEAQRPEQMVANVFHLFRVLGRSHLSRLRSLLSRDGEHVEPLALTSFRFAVGRPTCDDSPAAGATDDAMYEYAAFLLNTVGGQAYLQRRMPRTASLATFYALLVVDHAESERRNRHGVDPRPHLARCRAGLASQPLVLGSEYLAVLDRMERRWEAR